MKNSKFKSMYFLLTVLVFNCQNQNKAISEEIDPESDPNFTIVANEDTELSSFNRKVVVFGLDIYAVQNVTDKNLLHAANLLAQYLDNDEDSLVDDPNVLNAMIDNKAYLVMWENESDLDISPPDNRIGQDLGNDETHPEWHTNQSGTFDAAIEEVWHLVTHAGYASAYPDIFGEFIGSTLANSMDEARGGQFETIPGTYPADAWYTYDDQTCDYSCMVTEYVYWAMTSMLGAQANRLHEIEQEWKLNTLLKVQSQDPDIYSLLTSDQYELPKVLPDGSYRH